MKSEQLSVKSAEQPKHIDISVLSFDFLSEEKIKKYYSKDKMYQEKLRPVNVLRTARELADKTEEIKEAIARRLGKFLPEWRLDRTVLNLTITELGNWTIKDVKNRTIIEGDLETAALSGDPFESIVRGATHEIFHLWMEEKHRKSEKKAWYAEDLSGLSDQELKEKMIFTTIDEGLASKICDQSLEQSLSGVYEPQGKDYAEYVRESFWIFNEFIKAANRDELNKFFVKNLFTNFSVVGNEIAKIVLEKVGIDNFKKMIEGARNNPGVFFDAYKAICVKNPELPEVEI